MITPVHYKTLLEGKSNAHLLTFNDGKDYVVKFFQPGMEKAVSNEWIGYCLARYLGLPIPFARIIEIPAEFFSQVPQLATFANNPFQFASLYLSNCKDGHQVEQDPMILNSSSLAGIILLDYWLCNKDRTRKNILLEEVENGYHHLWVIDQAEIFGSHHWVRDELEALPVEVLKSATHQILAKSIDDEQSFYEYFELIQTMPIHLIEEIVAVLPDEWLVSPEEKKAIVTTLVTRRRKLLPELMKKFIKKVYRPLHQNSDDTLGG